MTLVTERISDGHVPIDADAAQMKQWCRAEENIVSVEDVTDDGTERPASGDLLERVERHDEHGNEEVGNGERDEERVGDDAQSLEA